MAKMKEAGEDEELVDLEEKASQIKEKLQKFKVEIGEKRLERAMKLHVLAIDNKDPKDIEKYEKIITGTQAQIDTARQGANLTTADKGISISDDNKSDEEKDDTMDVNWANLFAEDEENDDEAEESDKKEVDDEEKKEDRQEAEMKAEEEKEEGSGDEDEEEGQEKEEKAEEGEKSDSGKSKEEAEPEVEEKDVGKQIPGLFVSKYRIKLLKAQLKLAKGEWKKQRKVKAHKKKEKLKYRIKGYRVKFAAKMTRKFKEEIKLQKKIAKIEKKLKKARKALSKALDSGKETAIVKARKAVLKYKDKKDDEHKDWLSDQKAEVKECTTETKSAKKQIRKAKKFLRKYKRKLKPQKKRQMKREEELKVAKALDINPHKLKKAINKAKKKLKKAVKKVKKTQRKIAKYRADLKYFKKELKPTWSKKIPLALLEIPKIKLYIVKADIHDARRFLNKMRETMAIAKDSNDDERTEICRKWVQLAKASLQKSLRNRVGYYRNYGMTLQKQLDRATKEQKNNLMWVKIMKPNYKYKQALTVQLAAKTEKINLEKKIKKLTEENEKLEGSDDKADAKRVIANKRIIEAAEKKIIVTERKIERAAKNVTKEAAAYDRYKAKKAAIKAKKAEAKKKADAADKDKKSESKKDDAKSKVKSTADQKKGKAKANKKTAKKKRGRKNRKRGRRGYKKVKKDAKTRVKDNALVSKLQGLMTSNSKKVVLETRLANFLGIKESKLDMKIARATLGKAMKAIEEDGKRAVVDKDAVDDARREINLAKKSIDTAYENHLDTEKGLFEVAAKIYAKDRAENVIVVKDKPETRMKKYEAIDKSKTVYRAKRLASQTAKIEFYNIKITEAEKDLTACEIFLKYGREKAEDALVEDYTQDFTEAVKVLGDFKVAKANELLNDGKKDLMKASKHRDFESKRIARKEILDAKEKIVHAKAWKAK